MRLQIDSKDGVPFRMDDLIIRGSSENLNTTDLISHNTDALVIPREMLPLQVSEHDEDRDTVD